MKHVTFIKPMIPHNIGDRRLVPDAVAARLEAEGLIAPNPPDFPPSNVAGLAPAAGQAALPAKPRGKRYQTKG
jgi:hypothetical protein